MKKHVTKKRAIIGTLITCFCVYFGMPQLAPVVTEAACQTVSCE